MPQIFRFGPYLIFFWSNEGVPLEPVHIHVAEGVPTGTATKIWITKSGKTLLCNNNSKIPSRTLKIIMRIIEARSGEIIQKWTDYFGSTEFFC